MILINSDFDFCEEMGVVVDEQEDLFSVVILRRLCVPASALVQEARVFVCMNGLVFVSTAWVVSRL